MPILFFWKLFYMKFRLGEMKCLAERLTHGVPTARIIAIEQSRCYRYIIPRGWVFFVSLGNGGTRDRI